jgi:hypothetical protein
MSVAGRQRATHSPCTRSALRQIEDLARIEQILKLLHQLGSLIAAGFRVDEHDDGLDARRRNRFDHEAALLLLGLFALPARRPFLLLAAAWRFAQTRLEALAGRQLDDPRRWHDDVGVGTW